MCDACCGARDTSVFEEFDDNTLRVKMSDAERFDDIIRRSGPEMLGSRLIEMRKRLKIIKDQNDINGTIADKLKEDLGPGPRTDMSTYNPEKWHENAVVTVPKQIQGLDSHHDQLAKEQKRLHEQMVATNGKEISVAAKASEFVVHEQGYVTLFDKMDKDRVGIWQLDIAVKRDYIQMLEAQVKTNRENGVDNDLQPTITINNAVQSHQSQNVEPENNLLGMINAQTALRERTFEQDCKDLKRRNETAQATAQDMEAEVAASPIEQLQSPSSSTRADQKQQPYFHVIKEHAEANLTQVKAVLKTGSDDEAGSLRDLGSATDQVESDLKDSINKWRDDLNKCAKALPVTLPNLKATRDLVDRNLREDKATLEDTKGVWFGKSILHSRVACWNDLIDDIETASKNQEELKIECNMQSGLFADRARDGAGVQVLIRRTDDAKKTAQSLARRAKTQEELKRTEDELEKTLVQQKQTGQQNTGAQKELEQERAKLLQMELKSAEQNKQITELLEKATRSEAELKRQHEDAEAASLSISTATAGTATAAEAAAATSAAALNASNAALSASNQKVAQANQGLFDQLSERLARLNQKAGSCGMALRQAELEADFTYSAGQLPAGNDVADYGEATTYTLEDALKRCTETPGAAGVSWEGARFPTAEDQVKIWVKDAQSNRVATGGGHTLLLSDEQTDDNLFGERKATLACLAGVQSQADGMKQELASLAADLSPQLDAIAKEAKAIFHSADTANGGDNALSHTELKNFIQQDPALRERLSAYKWKAFFKDIDADGDGIITEEEFVAYYIKTMPKLEVAAEVEEAVAESLRKLAIALFAAESELQDCQRCCFVDQQKTIETRIVFLSAQLATLSAAQKHSAQSLLNSAKQVEDLRAELVQANEDLANTREQLREANAAIASTKESTTNILTDRLNELEKQLTTLRENLNEVVRYTEYCDKAAANGNKAAVKLEWIDLAGEVDVDQIEAAIKDVKDNQLPFAMADTATPALISVTQCCVYDLEQTMKKAESSVTTANKQAVDHHVATLEANLEEAQNSGKQEEARADKFEDALAKLKAQIASDSLETVPLSQYTETLTQLQELQAKIASRSSVSNKILSFLLSACAANGEVSFPGGITYHEMMCLGRGVFGQDGQYPTADNDDLMLSLRESLGKPYSAMPSDAIATEEFLSSAVASLFYDRFLLEPQFNGADMDSKAEHVRGLFESQATELVPKDLLARVRTAHQVSSDRQRQMRQIYDEIDIDGDEEISGEEMMHFGKILHENDDGEWDSEKQNALWASIDRDGNNAVDFDEFCYYYRTVIYDTDDMLFTQGVAEFLAAAEESRRASEYWLDQEQL